MLARQFFTPDTDYCVHCADLRGSLFYRKAATAQSLAHAALKGIR
jgi:hypothetical protein